MDCVRQVRKLMVEINRLENEFEGQIPNACKTSKERVRQLSDTDRHQAVHGPFDASH